MSVLYGYGLEAMSVVSAMSVCLGPIGYAGSVCYVGCVSGGYVLDALSAVSVWVCHRGYVGNVW